MAQTAQKFTLTKKIFREIINRNVAFTKVLSKMYREHSVEKQEILSQIKYFVKSTIL